MMRRMSSPQPLVLRAVPAHARFLAFDASPRIDPRPMLRALAELYDPETMLVGIGEPLTRRLEVSIPGLRTFPAMTGPGSAFPSSQRWAWIYLAGDDLGELVDRGRVLREKLHPFTLREDVATFRYRGGRDLTGYEDGTENPTGDKAKAAAIVSGREKALEGSSFVSVQRWIHDLDGFRKRGDEEGDAIFGRSRVENLELPDAPVSAHVKRAAQETFDPPAFMVRRSMPWVSGEDAGLYFVAFGESLDRFERVLGRMAGLEDGVVDALLDFTRPLTGAHYWCPPLVDGALSFAALGL